MFLDINYLLIERIIYVKLRYGINSRTSCGQIADRSMRGRRPVPEKSPTSFNDRHAPILTKLVGDRSCCDLCDFWKLFVEELSQSDGNVCVRL